MSKGTILYIGGFELPDKNAAAHRVLSNGKIFKELGYKVVFIDVDKTLSYNSDILTTIKDVQGFECWSIPYPQKTIEWTSYLSSIDYLNSMKKQYKDIKGIIAYNYPALALNNLRKYGKKNNVKVFADCTEWYSTKGSNLVFKVIKGLDSFLRMRIIQKRLDGLIVISKFLESYYGNTKNVVRIPPLVDINEKKWSKSKQVIINEFDNRLRFVYSGSPGKNKDKIVNIIEALYDLKDLSNYQMNIVGISKNQFIKDFPNYQKKIDSLDNRVNFVGRVSHEESLEELQNADYSIFIREKSKLTMAGFPTKFVESITCSIPIITTDSSDIKEYFLDETYGILLKDSTVDIIREVLQNVILNNVNMRKEKCGINNKMFHYSEYQELISKLLLNVAQ